MKHFLSILVILLFFSCNAQEKEIDITGNWYLSPHKGLEGFTYKEIFISDKVISVYQDIYGFNIEYFYTQEKNVLYLIINDENIKHSNIQYINENVISFELIDGSFIIYKRIIGDELTFEDYLFKDPYKEGKHKSKLEGEFLKAFNSRKKINTSQKK